ncbi:oligosaccharyl transferase subunit OST3/OST6 family [Epithele typhae]|uniref:oligosaccharyl transferase subunit OST3/OST6 family n=1 Tax=Epithele typhae TaxID=378194 RepID=UPI002008CD58|nr:oligosaccharyl transferase subunit OST3/OST6 family [Epithele typhae]KAH9946035.1 oligosaccharyl transferase subunit OST3/OST6 family [Epithele typhae]
MLLLPFLSLLALPFCLAASADSAYEQLTNLAKSNNGLIKLDDKSYGLLTHAKRNWTSSVHFTALDPRRRCAPCKEFDPSFTTVAKAWNKVPARDRSSHFFATADFDSAMGVFQKLGIQSAPVVHIYPAAEGPRRPANGRISPIVYDFSNGFDAGPLAEQLSAWTPVPIPYKAPIDWAKYGTTAGFVLIALSSIRIMLPVIRSRWAWAVGIVLTSLVMTSGFMFVRIRGMPPSGQGGQWIAQGYQNQFGQEVQVVSFVYGLLSASFLMLTLITPYQSSPARQRLQVYLWSGVIFVMFSVLISLFRVKNRSYPFKLLL